MLINVPVSIGELFDKISILDIKTKKIKNKNDLKLIKYELFKLKKIVKSKGLTNAKIKKKYLLLKSINEKLWNIENKKRRCEKLKKFDDSFIDLARKVYIYNDKRALIKKDINNLSGSSIVEIKSHK
tara:strand:- start:3789 stop:4169 length:381 start_codon:yes stop_codon:yes gene_type:complete